MPRINLSANLSAILALIWIAAAPPSPVPASLPKPLLLWEVPTELTIHSFSLSPNGRQIAIGGILFTDEAVSSRIELWDLMPPRKIQTIETGKKETVNQIEFDPTGKFMACAYGKGHLGIWSIDGKRLLEHQFKGTVMHFALQPGKNALAVFQGSEPGRIVLYDIDKRSISKEFGEIRSGVDQVCFSPDGKFLALKDRRNDLKAVESTVTVWDVGKGTKTHTFNRAKCGASSAVFSPDGKSLLVTWWKAREFAKNLEWVEVIVAAHSLQDPEKTETMFETNGLDDRLQWLEFDRQRSRVYSKEWMEPRWPARYAFRIVDRLTKRVSRSLEMKFHPIRFTASSSGKTIALDVWDDSVGDIGRSRLLLYRAEW